MNHRPDSWLVCPRETGHGFFHFIGNDALCTRQLDIHIDLRMDDVLAATLEEVHALRMFAFDMNHCKGRLSWFSTIQVVSNLKVTSTFQLNYKVAYINFLVKGWNHVHDHTESIVLKDHIIIYPIIRNH